MPKENIYIVTNASQAGLMNEVTSGRLAEDRILAEPAARNTAACIGYAAVAIRKKYGDSVMCVLPSDHYVKDKDAYREVMDFAMDLAEKEDRLVTVGIKPTEPATGYGYIKYNKRIDEIAHRVGAVSQKRITAYPVSDFVEKPSLPIAKSYVEQGRYLWNSGMFLWKTSVILKYFERLLPDVYECLMEIEEAIERKKKRKRSREYIRRFPKYRSITGLWKKRIRSLCWTVTSGGAMLEAGMLWTRYMKRMRITMWFMGNRSILVPKTVLLMGRIN